MKKGERESMFLNNGSLLLEELIASCDGRCNPIRSFSAKDLIKATNNFDSHHLVLMGGYYTVYKCSLQDRQILVKKYFDGTDTSLAIRDIVISSQMSNHKNSLKLLGCCLEFKIPALVCEYAGDGVLFDHLYGVEGGCKPDEPLSWKSRIRIAKDIANAVTFLHTAFPRPIVHRRLLPSIVFLDEHGVAKLSDFSLSISIPHDESLVEDVVRGPLGFLDPEYLRTGYVTEKIDVYHFGVLLLVLLTGQKSVMDRGQGLAFIREYVKDYVDKDRFNDIVDPKILGEGGGIEQKQQLQAFVELAFKCTLREGVDRRPAMIDVAKELRRIERSIAVLPC